MAKVTEKLRQLADLEYRRKRKAQEREKALLQSDASLAEEEKSKRGKMISFLGRSKDRRLRLQKERQEVTIILQEQLQIKATLQSRLDALNEKKA